MYLNNRERYRRIIDHNIYADPIYRNDILRNITDAMSNTGMVNLANYGDWCDYTKEAYEFRGMIENFIDNKVESYRF